MSDKKKVLIVTQEMEPYTTLTEISEVVRQLPQHIQDNGMEIRVLMPRYGTINERRHRLHEVVRLSGMNIIVDDDDYPLIIKVASLPDARIQVYFLDNDDFFKRKAIFEDKEGKPFEDNVDRMVFFCKGVIETVKKFGWPPDIVHCHGWMTSLIPLYLKTAYQTEPLFQNAKVIYSAYKDTLDKLATDKFIAKATINNLSPEDLDAYQNGSGVNLHEGAIHFADAVIRGSEALGDSVEKQLKSEGKPTLEYQDEEEKFLPSYIEFYNSLLEEKVSD
ncbi:MAG: glycogen/starch synthase [Saprospiraceae bacterium]|nr:glycogen/starch synthase [Saprospiraceae bacterium]